MKILHRYMLKQFIVPFIGAFLLCIFILLMQILWKYIDDLVGKGLELAIIAELLLYACGQLAILAFPLAVLLASIFTLGGMGENYELIALKAAGISLQRILTPLVITSFVISICAFMCGNYMIPVANLKWRTLVYDIQQQRPELSIPEGVFYNGIDGWSIRIGSRDHRTQMLYDLRIYNHTERAGNVQVILADSGRMQITADRRFLEVTLHDGHSYTDIVHENRRTVRQNQNYPFQRDKFEKQIFRMDLPEYAFERSDEQIFASGHKYMNLDQLTYMIDSFSNIIVNQENQLRTTVQPLYQPPELTSVDTTLRSRIPDDFMAYFNGLSKTKKQMTLHDAVNNARAQREQISGLVYEMNSYKRQTWRYKIAWHEKFTMPFACFVFFFIGAPLGAIIRKGGLGTPIIIAIIFFVFYYVISMIGERSAREGALTPLEGMWLAAFIILTVGFLLTWMATRDSSILSIETYVSYIRKGLGFVFVIHRTPRPELSFSVLNTDLSPENMITKIEKLSQLCKSYLDGDFRKRMRLSKIWYKHEDEKLAEIAQKYDHIRAIMKHSDVDMIRETVAEYPKVALHNCKIKKISNGHVAVAVMFFPVWIYLYVKTLIQKHSLRNELRNIIGANQNLINELNSVL